MRILPSMVALLFAGGAFYLGYTFSGPKTISQPPQQETANLRPHEPPDEPEVDFASELAKLRQENQQLREQLKQATEKREFLADRLQTLHQQEPALSWIKNQIDNGDFDFWSHLEMPEDFQPTDNLEGILGLSEEQKANLKSASKDFLENIQSWESQNAKLVEADNDVVRYEVPAPPAQMIEDYMRQVKTILDEDDFGIFDQTSKRTLKN